MTVFLKAPQAFRAEVSVDGAPFKGSATAPVTIVEVSDYHCPYCKQVQPTLKELLTQYGNDVKLVFKDYPMDSLHPGARKAAEASRCADDQGRFWPFHEKLFDGPSDSSPEKLKELAAQAGLDVPRSTSVSRAASTAVRCRRTSTKGRDFASRARRPSSSMAGWS